MRAAVNTRYGPPEVVRLREVARLVPRASEVLIQVHATTVNRTDCAFRSAANWPTRLVSGLFKPKNLTLGNEFAGEVVALGADVRAFRIGDRGFGFNGRHFGAHAEYLTMPQDAALALLPAHFSYEQAAPSCEGAHYALCNLRAAQVQSGQRVLVYGATGAIGSAAVQLAKALGATVTAVCDTKSVAVVQSLGPDEVLDYTRQDYAATGQTFDFLFDAVGETSFAQGRRVLHPRGIYSSTELGKNGVNVLLALATPLFGGRKVLFPIPAISQADVLYLKELAEAGRFRPLVDRSYPLEEIVAAYQYVETGQKTGNVVITLP